MRNSSSSPDGVLRHAVLGAGGVGLSLASDLARAGQHVTLVMRPQSLMHYNGVVRVLRPERSTATFAVPAVARLAELVDVVWIAVKQPQLLHALGSLDAAASTSALVISLLNGIDHMNPLRSMYGPRAVAGAIRVEACRESIGTVVRKSLFTELDLAFPHPGHPVVPRIAKSLRTAGIACRTDLDEATVLWGKLSLLAPLALATTCAGGPLKMVRQNPELARLMTKCVREVCAVAATEGVVLHESRLIRCLSIMPDRSSSSLQRDSAVGAPLELEAISTPVLRAAVHTPATEELVRRARSAV
ncbi:ketopantoate reductase family protein [Streptomyces sp. NPDC087908]|uniref:ketopantoate reductase family protein n=1 Tax=Streptomyces sp. NPDC087908 TaxID=3365820 RepID=UPI003812287F